MTVYTKSMMEALTEVRGIQTEASMNPAMIDKLKKAYEPMRGKKISVGNANKLSALLDKFAKDKDTLIQLFKADIPFVTQGAAARLISKHNMKGAEINKLKEEFNVESVELDEAKYEIYHKDFSSAMQHAYKMAKKLHGITVDPKEIDDKVASGPRKPSSGKTNSYRLKGDKGNVQIQVANLDNKKYELNMYKEEVELGEGFINIGGAKVKDDEKSILQHIKKTFPNVKKVRKDPQHGWIPVFEEDELDEGDPFMRPTKGKEKVVTIRHKTSGKELSVTANSVKKYEKMGYKVVKEETELEAYELGTDEYREYLEKLTPGEVDEASARADAMKAMRKGKKDVDPADVDTDASDADVKAASKNIMMQMRKAVSLSGRFDVEFLDKKKVKVKPAIANAFIKKYQSMRRPADKEKLQNQAMKSYKDLLKVLKSEYMAAQCMPEEVELDEALPSHLQKFFDKDGNPKSKEGKAAWERIKKTKMKGYTPEQIKMAIGVAFDKRYVQGNMTGAAKTIEKIAKGLSDLEPVRNALRRANENTILDRIDAKLKERKNG